MSVIPSTALPPLAGDLVRRGPLLLLLGALLVAPPSSAETRNGFDVSNASIPRDEIVGGGPPRDGIPAIFQPKFLAAEDADFLAGDDRVIGVALAGEARAYPVRILNWHETVNDRIGDQSVVVTYCPLCGTGMVFAANIGKGRLVFGVSGLLYNSDVLLYDRNTESLWSQLMGEAVTGPMQGTLLPQLPALHTTWADWRKKHPATRVLSTETGYRRDYDRSPYAGYEKSRRLYFDVAHRAPRDYHPKALVLGVRLGGVARAYPFDELDKPGRTVIEDIVGAKKVVVHFDAESRSAYLTDENGTEVPSTLAYWFAWFAFNPDTEIFRR